MKTTRLFQSFILAALLVPSALAWAAAPKVLTVAVFDFESKDEAVRDLGPKVAALINAGLSAEQNIVTVERAELEKVLGELELGLSGSISPDSAAKAGQLMGAKVLVTGRIFKIEKETVMVAKIIGTETSRVYGEMAKGSGTDAVTELASELAKRIAKVVTTKGDTLVAKAESREERLDKLTKSLKNGKRPIVSVKVTERNAGASVIDPAVETELLVILQKAGFKIMDEKSSEKPDLEITGEAFSAFGMRKGNLISCKARVELKVHERNSGKLIAVDRQSGVALDIAEPTAAKTALQNAAMELAERMLPRLVK